MAYVSRRRRFFFLSPDRAAFALLAAFLAPFDAGFNGMTADENEKKNLFPPLFYMTRDRVSETSGLIMRAAVAYALGGR